MRAKRIRLWKWTLLAVGVALQAPLCMAQAAAGRNDADAARGWNWYSGPDGGMSLAQTMEAGGWLMWVIAALSVVAMAMIAYFFYVLRPVQIAPLALHRDLIEKIEDGDLDSARRLCESRPCALSAVVLAATDYVRGIRSVEEPLLKDMIEGEGSRQAEDIQGQAQYLLDLAVIAPMVGLLGTVFGMLHAFGGIANDIASAKPVVLAEGVAMALLTTAFGLIVGIPAMAFYAYFRRRSAKLVAYLEMAATDVLTAMLNRAKHGMEAGVKVQTREERT